MELAQGRLRQIVKEKAIGMRAEEFSDPLFVLSDERQKTLELLGQQFNSQAVGLMIAASVVKGLAWLISARRSRIFFSWRLLWP